MNGQTSNAEMLTSEYSRLRSLSTADISVEAPGDEKPSSGSFWTKWKVPIIIASAGAVVGGVLIALFRRRK